jgi:hypothetical protein
MKRFAVCAAVAGACLWLVIGYAGPKDFWSVKPYTEWTAAEVEKILQKNSPWTHVLLLLPSEGESGGRGSKGSPNPSYSTPVYIIWNSRIVREAIVRKTMLEAPETPKEQNDKALNYKPQHLEIFVNGPVLGRGRGAGGEQAVAAFKAKAFLQKKNKVKVSLTDMVMPRNGSITLLFPREVDGKPWITPEDKEITLGIRIGENDYKFVFKLANMVVNGNLEI